MKSFLLKIIVVYFSLVSFSQVNDCDIWEFPNTASNATIAILEDNFNSFLIISEETGESVGISSIACEAQIGVFYTDDVGELSCAGYVAWNSAASMALSAWGDDTTTPEKDGFFSGESYFFKLCVYANGNQIGVYDQSFLTMSTDTPFSNTYATNGMASIQSISFEINSDDFFDITVGCAPVHLSEQKKMQDIVQEVDLYGRDIGLSNSSGFIFQIYSDQTVSKFYRF